MKKLLMLGLPRSPYSIEKSIEEANSNDIKLYIADQEELISKYEEKLKQNNVEVIKYDKLDLDYLKSIVIEKSIDNVFSLTEFQLENAARLRENLKLVGDYTQVTINTRDKYKTRLQLDKYKIPNIRYEKCRTEDLLDVYRLKMPKKCVIKPLDLTGSIGVQKVNSEEDIIDFLSTYKKHDMLSGQESFLLEEFIEGKEISVEGFVIEKKFHLIGITEKFTTGEPYFIEIGHRLPMQINDKSLEMAIINYTEACIQALGITQGPIHEELRLSKSGPLLIEIHTRYGGDNITELISNVYGLNIYELYYKTLLEEEIYNFTANPKRICQIKFFFTNEGCIEKLIVDEDLLQKTEIKKFTIHKKVGDIIEAYPHRLASIGSVIFQADNYEAITSLEREIEDKVKITVIGRKKTSEKL